MVLVHIRQGGTRFVLVATLLASSWPVCGQPPLAPLDELIGNLNHPSFASRQSAARALTTAGLGEWQRSREQKAEFKGIGKETGDPVISALRGATTHDSLEVRMAASRILQDLSIAVHNAELERLLNPHCDPSTIRLDHWASFAALVGDDLPARTSFAGVSRRLGNRPYWRRESPDRGNQLKRLSDQLDPYRLDPADTTAWMLLLMLDLEQCESLPHVTPRLAVAMSHCPMGPATTSSVEGLVLGRLIDRWVCQAGHLCGDRERLLIAMRYDRRSTAGELCQRVLEDDGAPAATVVTGLLVASVLGREDLEDQLTRRLEDDRVAHVWQMIPSQKTRIRTEVRDVALALWLHHHGVDPRSAGFEELQADPLLRFRDHSLGFQDAPARLECRRRADELLAKETDLVVDCQRD